MKRREFVTLLAGGAIAWSLAARAQTDGRAPLIGVLMGYGENDPAAQSWLAAFRGAFAKLGWMEGGNFRIELRWAGGDAASIKTLAKELVDLRPDALLGVTTPVIAALARETRTIPIVFAIVSDPIGGGFAASVAHPRGNVTGFMALDPLTYAKFVGLLKEIAPRTARVALLFNPATAVPIRLFMPSIQAAASSSAVQVSAGPAHTTKEIESAIAAQATTPGGGLIVMPDPFMSANRDLIVALAARYGVPAIYDDVIFPKSGGLISYGADRAEEFRQAAGYIDRILKGEKPADLPLQMPTKLELTINLKSAKALGLSVPLTLQASADEVIE